MRRWSIRRPAMRGGLRLSPHHPRESAVSLTNEVRFGYAEGSLSGRGCEGCDLGAAGGGVSEAEIARRLVRPKRTVSKYLQRMGGIRPRPCRGSERCLSLAEREEISRGIARGRLARAQERKEVCARLRGRSCFSSRSRGRGG